jgi:hypothetical protein
MGEGIEKKCECFAICEVMVEAEQNSSIVLRRKCVN